MTRRIISAVSRALSTRSTLEERPHFHQGAQGNFAPCFHPNCTKPSLHA
ncbi:MAG TPA: hypothetical protein VGM33_14865 [Baekduia sp.]|jgi:hypothetical protein